MRAFVGYGNDSRQNGPLSRLSRSGQRLATASFRAAEPDCNLIQSQSVAFAVGRQPRTDFAFGVSMATADRVSKWPEKPVLFGFLRGQKRFAKWSVEFALSARRRTPPHER